MKKILFIACLFLLVMSCFKRTIEEEAIIENNPIYLDENKITIKCLGAEDGLIHPVNGKEYEVVYNQSLRQKIKNKEDLSCICTSNVTNMSTLFGDDLGFNQDIGSRDLSSVTDTS